MDIDKNGEQLFEYLRSILYDDNVQPIALDKLNPALEKLGKGMQYLEKAVREMKEYSAAISVGNLSVEVPPRDNFLCENLKNIHANLNHLSWQAKQVAKGDYSQNVSYLGEFSEAFNTMTSQLKEREASLKQEAEREKMHASMVESYNHLLLQLIERSKEEILVLSCENQEILYCSARRTTDANHKEIYEICRKKLAERQKEGKKPYACEWEWEEQDSRKHYYRIYGVAGAGGLRAHYPGYYRGQRTGRKTGGRSIFRCAYRNRKSELSDGKTSGFLTGRRKVAVMLL